MDGASVLTWRVAQLDQLGNSPRTRSLSNEFEHFVRTMDTTVNLCITSDLHDLPLTTDVIADEIVDASTLLRRLKYTNPEVVTGPLKQDSQHWIATGKPSHLPKPDWTLSRSSFVDAATATYADVSTKPFGVGLFTSTSPAVGIPGMWRIYLDFHRSSLSPKPWHTWAVQPNTEIEICEIASASDWVRFVLSRSVEHEGFLYPDWKATARRYDAVHMTLPAVLATQGVCLSSARGTIAPTYWDVESTFWLRWCFRSVALIDVIRPSGAGESWRPRR